MYYKLRCNSTQFVSYYKLRNYYKLQRNRGSPAPLIRHWSNWYDYRGKKKVIRMEDRTYADQLDKVWK